jgi:hypothetical protein
MDNEAILEQEQVAEETSVAEPEPLIIETKGKFQPFEAMTGQELEVGKTYNIKVAGVCEFAISKDRPLAGLKTNEISYTKNSDTLKLWIKTGG